jgi:uncharacterized heparinase superfamily protein
MMSDGTLERWLRRSRRALSSLPGLGGPFTAAPAAPASPSRDPWPGDATRGAALLKGELVVAGTARPLREGAWDPPGAAQGWLAAAHGFAWLRDLRTLGSDAARLRARALVADWLDHAAPEIAGAPDIRATRITAWLGHWDFFAATADEVFRARVTTALVNEARDLAADLPAEMMDGRALTALKGLTVAASALPGSDALMTRALRFLPAEIDRQISAEGDHAEQSPMALLMALVDLLDIRTALAAAAHPQGAAASATVAAAIERAAPTLRALRHGDGGLAQFNSTREDSLSLVEAVLAQAPARTRASARAPAMGFQRLAAGRTLVIVDAAAPPSRDRDRLSHAGTTAFEMSVGRERLIVNCGAAPAGGSEWQTSLRATAAHSTLVLADTNSSELRGSGLGRRPETVVADRHEAGGAHWLDVSHDGWRRGFGVTHHRRLYLAESGDDVRGEDVLDGPGVEQGRLPGFTVRFHLHPSVQTSLQPERNGVLLRLGSGAGWALRAEGAALSLEESIYFGVGDAKRTEQVVLTGRFETAAPIKWAITRLA